MTEAGITKVTVRTYGGTALCDWLPAMRADAATLHPAAVVIEFSGNAFTPCMHDVQGQALSGAGYYAKYASDALAAILTFAADDTKVYFAGAPIPLSAVLIHEPNANRLNELYASLADISNVHYIDAGASVLNHGQWTETLPCLPDESCTGGTNAEGMGVNVVRAPDGRHFCPEEPPAVQGVTASCGVWDSGAFRYATAMAGPVIADLVSESARDSGSPVFTPIDAHP
jgi:hypothetical protein